MLNLVKKQAINTLLLTHNSITRCLIGNVRGIDPKIWVENRIGNGEMFQLDYGRIDELQKGTSDIRGIIGLLQYFFENNDGKIFNLEFLSDFAKIALHEENTVLEFLNNMCLSNNNQNLQILINLVSNTIELKTILSEINESCNVPGIYSVLHFGSSLYGRNHSVTDTTDLDIEIIIDENFDINSIKDTVLSGYRYGEIEKDFQDFLDSNADYFSFKSYYKGRLIDFRITRNQCFQNICSNSLQQGDEYIMKEFRKQFRANGIVEGRRGFDQEFTWENKIEYPDQGQIIHYPLFRYENGIFCAGNNIDKYCSFTDIFKNEIRIKKSLLELRKKFLETFNEQIANGYILPNTKISDIFIRKARFPKFMLEDLETRYDLISGGFII